MALGLKTRVFEGVRCSPRSFSGTAARENENEITSENRRRSVRQRVEQVVLNLEVTCVGGCGWLCSRRLPGSPKKKARDERTEIFGAHGRTLV